MVRLKLRFGSTIQAKLIESRSSGEPRGLSHCTGCIPYYYPVVVRYYERLTQEHPDYSYYCGITWRRHSIGRNAGSGPCVGPQSTYVRRTLPGAKRSLNLRNGSRRCWQAEGSLSRCRVISGIREDDERNEVGYIDRAEIWSLSRCTMMHRIFRTMVSRS